VEKLTKTKLLTGGLCLFLLGYCNLEVGNPDDDGPAGLTSFSTMSFSMSGGRCTQTAEGCVSAPLELASGVNSGMSIEMRDVRLQLAGIELKPFQPEPVTTQINLLSGSKVYLSKVYESSAINTIAADFSVPKGSQVSSLLITGSLYVPTATETLAVPLNITYNGTILANSTVTAQNTVVDGVVFDAAHWFDLSSLPREMQDQLLKNLTSGACRDITSPMCEKYRDTIARRIADNISRSMSVKSVPAAKRQNMRKP